MKTIIYLFFLITHFFKVNINEIKSVHIKNHKINYYFYSISLSIFIIGLLVCQILNTSFVLVQVFLILLICRAYFMIRYRTFSMVVLLKNTVTYEFYFKNTKRYYFLDKIKLIRTELLVIKEKEFKNN